MREIRQNSAHGLQAIQDHDDSINRAGEHRQVPPKLLHKNIIYLIDLFDRLCIMILINLKV